MNGSTNINTLVSSFFNEYVFSEAKMNINYIRDYMNQNFPHSTVYYELLDLIENKNLADITPDILRLKFETLGKSEDESTKLLGKIIEFKSYSKAQIQPFIELLRQICTKGYIDKINSRVGNNSVEFVELIKKYDYKSNFSSNLSMKNFSELDITDLVDRYSAVGYKSRYDFINNSFSVGGYIPGQIVQVVAAPSCFTGDTEVIVRSKEYGECKCITLEELESNYHLYEIKTYNEDSGEFQWNEFKCWKVKEVGFLSVVEFNDGHSYLCTIDHQWLLEDNQWVDALDLSVGDKIKGCDSYITDTYEVILGSGAVVYDINIRTKENNHTFCLSNGAVVHNCGKSLFMQGECVNFVNQGKKCHYLTLGDLNELDMAIRLTGMMSGYPKARVENNIIELYNQFKDRFAKYLSMTVVPSGVIKATEYVDWILKAGEDFDILFIDYDSNFNKDESLSLYDYGGALYDCLTQLTRAGKLVFVASQPKICYFGEELLPLEAAGESSRKQHICDVIITIGRNWHSKYKMGKINIAKSRRGDNAIQPYLATSDGLFYPCTDIMYQRFLNQRSSALYTYDELKVNDVVLESIEEQKLNSSEKTVTDIINENK